MDFKDYTKRKNENRIVIQKAGEKTVVIVSEKFDQHTGGKLENDVETMSLEAVVNHRAALVEERDLKTTVINELDALITDIKETLKTSADPLAKPKN